MAGKKTTVVFVHGWSVTTTETYGGLPVRLQVAAKAAGLDVQVKEIFLGRYISFHDEVRLEDISRAFRAAVTDELGALVKADGRFVCITHSTGGPVIRDWWNRYYQSVPRSGVCPLSHLVMLAPANFGSALAQLGKSRVGRMKSWFGGVEPGQGVLDWLELGSEPSWELNRTWIQSGGNQIGPKGVFPFVLTGQSIDRAFYDNLNSYTGEIGSDGVVRVAAANLCSRYIRLEQELPRPGRKKGEFVAPNLVVKEFTESPATALRIISGKSHSGKVMGIMNSVKKVLSDKKSNEAVNAILRCIQVATKVQYTRLSKDFARETDQVQKDERLEKETRRFRRDIHFIHDRYSMVVFRVRDHKDYPVDDFDLILTAGPEANPDHLPKGFFADRQRNNIHREIITYYFNHDIMQGSDEITDDGGKVIRATISGADMLGFRLVPRPGDGFVHYLPCEIKASNDLLGKSLHPNSTTLIDIRLRRVVRKNVFRMSKVTNRTRAVNFKKTKPGNEIVTGGS